MIIVASGLWPDTQDFPANLSGHSPDATSFAEISVGVLILWLWHAGGAFGPASYRWRCRPTRQSFTLRNAAMEDGQTAVIEAQAVPCRSAARFGFFRRLPRLPQRRDSARPRSQTIGRWLSPGRLLRPKGPQPVRRRFRRSRP